MRHPRPAQHAALAILAGARRLLPLPARRRLVLAAVGATWLPRRSALAWGLLEDWAHASPAQYHRWLWRHHAAYPEIYDAALRFAPGSIERARLELFDDLTACLRHAGVDPIEIRSVLEVGSSLGYLLRHVEQNVFPAAEVLDGIDIDLEAVEAGNHVLVRSGSRAHLFRQDAVGLDRFLAGRTYDVVVCAGMLMYLDEQRAAALVAAMLAAADVAVAMTAIALPDRDNETLEHSLVRDWDSAYIHNLDAMVRHADGTILFRRWDGPRLLDGLTVYHVIARRASRG